MFFIYRNGAKICKENPPVSVQKKIRESIFHKIFESLQHSSWWRSNVRAWSDLVFSSDSFSTASVPGASKPILLIAPARKFEGR